MKFLILVSMLSIAVCGKSQSPDPPFKSVIRIYPLQLYRVFPTATIGYEHRVSDNFSLTTEVAPFLNLSLVGSDYTGKSGIRLREELRYYSKYKYSLSRPTYARGTYWAVDLQLTSAHYYEYSEKQKWNEAGFGFKFGTAEYLNRITLDYAVGIAFRYAENAPPDLWASIINFGTEGYPIIQPVISFGVGYRF